MQQIYRLGILGCGKLGRIVAGAVKDGMLPEYALCGLMSRNPIDAQKLAHECGGTTCKTMDELLATKPDYIVETASIEAFRELAPKALAAGISVVTLSIGAFADHAFYAQCARLASENNARVHIASGAIGGFDVIRTMSLMEQVSVRFSTEKGPESLRGTPVYTDELLGETRQVFEGTAREAINLFPTKVNVSIAASIASVGPEQVQMTICSTPGFIGDDHRIEVEGTHGHAVLDIYSKTSAIAGWSVVALLQNIASPIVF